MNLAQNKTDLTILLADDDIDDCTFFTKTLEEIPILTKLTIMHDGEDLMEYLNNALHMPDVLFLDLSMPRKTGFECLAEIAGNPRFNGMLVYVFTISYPHNKDFENEIKAVLHKMGAYEYVSKNYDFEKFKQTIHTSLNVAKEAILLKNENKKIS